MKTKHTRRHALRTLAAGGALVAVPVSGSARGLSAEALEVAEMFDRMTDVGQEATTAIVREIVKAQPRYWLTIGNNERDGKAYGQFDGTVIKP